MLALLCFFAVIYPQQEAEARKFIGLEQTGAVAYDDPNGECAEGQIRFRVRYERRIFWIGVGSPQYRWECR